MSDVTNGIGGVLSVTATAVRYLIAPAPPTDGNHKSATYVKVSNTGGSMLYALVNTPLAADLSTSNAVAIPAGGNFTFIKDPIKSLVLGCATGESTSATYGAY